MDVVESVLSNLNTWLVMFIVGIIVWVTRQILPDKIENSKLWKILLRVVPVAIGAFVALIPGLQPIADNLPQSAAIGAIGGSFSQTGYGFLREIVSKRLKDKLGSKASRTNQSEEVEIETDEFEQ